MSSFHLANFIFGEFFLSRSGGDGSKTALRRSCGSQDLLSVGKVFSGDEHAHHALFRQSSEPIPVSLSVPSSPRIARPPAKESHHVNRLQTEVIIFGHV